MTRLHDELAVLFGRGVLHQAHLTDPAALGLSAELMDRVHDAADELVRLAGNTRAQGAMVRALDHQTRLVLCMWASDTGLLDTLLRQVGAPATPELEVSR